MAAVGGEGCYKQRASQKKAFQLSNSQHFPFHNASAHPLSEWEWGRGAWRAGVARGQEEEQSLLVGTREGDGREAGVCVAEEVVGLPM